MRDKRPFLCMLAILFIVDLLILCIDLPSLNNREDVRFQQLTQECIDGLCADDIEEELDSVCFFLDPYHLIGADFKNRHSTPLPHRATQNRETAPLGWFKPLLA